MPSQPKMPAARRRLTAVAAVLAAVALATAAAVPPAAAQSGCSGRTPAFGVSSQLWSGLRPTDTGQIPSPRDSTDYRGLTDPDYRYPLFSSLEVEGGYVFTTYSSGLMVWDATTPANRRNPQLASVHDGWGGGFLAWFSGTHIETREWVWDVDVPDGDGGLLAAVGIGPVGMTIWDVSTPALPRQLYQDRGRTAYQVYTARIGARSYGFAATEQGIGNGLHVYDLTAARAFPTGCVEDTTQAIACPGVYLGRIGTAGSTSYVDGVATSAGRHFIAFASGSPAVGPRGVELLEVTQPAAPVNVRLGGGRFSDGEGLYGVALWEHDGRVLMALHALEGGRIYDLTGCLDGGCASLAGRLLWSRSWSVSTTRRFVTDSAGDGVPYLYFGTENMCATGLQREWLYDVSNPAAPQAVGTGVVVDWPNPGGSPDPYPIDYWSWYYAASPTGFSQVMPRMGKFSGRLFYRAAWTIFDVHERPAQPVDTIFADGFESGGTGAWSAAVGGG